MHVVDGLSMSLPVFELPWVDVVVLEGSAVAEAVDAMATAVGLVVRSALRPASFSSCGASCETR